MKFRVALAVVLAVVAAGCTQATAPTQQPASTGHEEVIPLLVNEPRIDGKISEAEWADALRLADNFTITDGSAASGTYPFTLWIGENERALFIAAEVRDLGRNPFSNESSWVPDRLMLYFTGSTGNLSVPSDEVGCANIEGFCSLVDGSWGGHSWTLQNDLAPGELNDSHPSGGRWMSCSLNGTAKTYEFFIGRKSPLRDVDGLQLDGVTSFRMLMSLVRQTQSPDRVYNVTDPQPEYRPDELHQDDWPGNGFTPFLDKNPSGWLALRTAN